MTSDRTSYHSHLPAPCIVDAGIIVNKQDMRRLLCDLGAVRYHYDQGGRCISEGEGYVVEVFSDPDEATLVTNHSLYLNVCSFDYLELSQIPPQESSSTPPASATTTLDSAIPHGPNCGCESSPDDPQMAAEASGSTACFRLVQENTTLRLVPLSNPLMARRDRTMNVVALEAVVADMLSANLDLSESDEEDENFPF
ncbi:MAG: hypothetical protein F6K30_25005 [Cyanothece sp. SIO2G6]|nr:hypothetical protein [Cyanothece sp. SIO2G6]